MLFIWEITKPSTYFLTTMARGTSSSLAMNVIVQPLFTHKDGSFSGEHSHPERIQWSLWYCTHINQGQELRLCLIVCVASLQGWWSWWVFMGEKEQVKEKYCTLSPTRRRQTSVLRYFRGLLYWCLPVTLNRNNSHGVNYNAHTCLLLYWFLMQ